MFAYIKKLNASEEQTENEKVVQAPNPAYKSLFDKVRQRKKQEIQVEEIKLEKPMRRTKVVPETATKKTPRFNDKGSILV